MLCCACQVHLTHAWSARSHIGDSARDNLLGSTYTGCGLPSGVSMCSFSERVDGLLSATGTFLGDLVEAPRGEGAHLVIDGQLQKFWTSYYSLKKRNEEQELAVAVLALAKSGEWQGSRFAIQHSTTTFCLGSLHGSMAVTCPRHRLQCVDEAPLTSKAQPIPERPRGYICYVLQHLTTFFRFRNACSVTFSACKHIARSFKRSAR